MIDNDRFWSFVACLTYGEEMVPMTTADAAYTLQNWKEEGSIEPPEGFTPEIFAEIWNSLCPETPVQETPAQGASFETGKSYWCNFHEYLTLEVLSRSEKTVTVKGYKKSRHKILTDENGNEYFEVKDPFKGPFRFSANHNC